MKTVNDILTQIDALPPPDKAKVRAALLPAKPVKPRRRRTEQRYQLVHGWILEGASSTTIDDWTALLKRLMEHNHALALTRSLCGRRFSELAPTFIALNTLMPEQLRHGYRKWLRGIKANSPEKTTPNTADAGGGG